MTNANMQSLRRAAMAGIAGAAATAIGGLLVQAVVQPATAVSDERWSYPWSSSALVPISILWACLHVLVFIGVLGFARSRLAGASRGARFGPLLALVGTALLFVGELASIPIRDQRTDEIGAAIVGAIFGIASLLTAAGFLAAGIATLRARLWRGWRRFTPLSAGIATCVLLGLDSTTKALPTGVALYGLCLLALGISLYTQPAPAPDAAETPPLTVLEQPA
jgi:hypothetical protein